MTTMTRPAYCARLDAICDLQEAGHISIAEMDRRLEAFKAATTVTEDAPAVTRSARRPAAAARPARPGGTVTLTRDQLRALVSLPPATPAPGAARVRTTEAARVRERHDRALTTVLAELAQPARMAPADLALLVMEAGGAGNAAPFYQDPPAQPEPATPPPAPAPMTARQLAGLPMEEFLAVGASQLAAGTQSHRSPFYRRRGAA